MQELIMQKSTVTSVLLSDTEVCIACAEYMDKHGVIGATKQHLDIQFQYFEGVISATLELTTTTPITEESTLVVDTEKEVEVESPKVKQEEVDIKQGNLKLFTT